ncbi:hypothetical protein [Streptomyces sp. NPDC088180]|uniref:hypothetical protein n=1 Tax=Streptomyces sp. NPDC088180 TaxID=3365837 RepID=UPI003826FD4E
MSGPQLESGWWHETESPKAWMSVRDADLYEALLHRVATIRRGEVLRVVEWGAGRSTLWYTAFLDMLGLPYTWLSIEYNKAFFEEHCAPTLRERPNAAIVTEGGAGVEGIKDLVNRQGAVVVLYDAGEVRPDLPEREADRAVNLDAYVSLPARLGYSCDIVVIDGRKRRRCLIEATRLVDPHGYVLIHDAWRTYYHCAYSEFESGRRFGDEWWIGSRRKTNFTEVLPWHAFKCHARADGV